VQQHYVLVQQVYYLGCASWKGLLLRSILNDLG